MTSRSNLATTLTLALLVISPTLISPTASARPVERTQAFLEATASDATLAAQGAAAIAEGTAGSAGDALASLQAGAARATEAADEAQAALWTLASDPGAPPSDLAGLAAPAFNAAVAAKDAAWAASIAYKDQAVRDVIRIKDTGYAGLVDAKDNAVAYATVIKDAAYANAVAAQAETLTAATNAKDDALASSVAAKDNAVNATTDTKDGAWAGAVRAKDAATAAGIMAKDASVDAAKSLSDLTSAGADRALAGAWDWMVGVAHDAETVATAPTQSFTAPALAGPQAQGAQQGGKTSPNFHPSLMTPRGCAQNEFTVNLYELSPEGYASACIPFNTPARPVTTPQVCQHQFGCVKMRGGEVNVRMTGPDSNSRITLRIERDASTTLSRFAIGVGSTWFQYDFLDANGRFTKQPQRLVLTLHGVSQSSLLSDVNLQPKLTLDWNAEVGEHAATTRYYVKPDATSPAYFGAEIGTLLSVTDVKIARPNPKKFSLTLSFAETADSKDRMTLELKRMNVPRTAIAVYMKGASDATLPPPIVVDPVADGTSVDLTSATTGRTTTIEGDLSFGNVPVAYAKLALGNLEAILRNVPTISNLKIVMTAKGNTNAARCDSRVGGWVPGDQEQVCIDARLAASGAVIEIPAMNVELEQIPGGDMSLDFGPCGFVEFKTTVPEADTTRLGARLLAKKAFGMDYLGLQGLTHLYYLPGASPITSEIAASFAGHQAQTPYFFAYTQPKHPEPKPPAGQDGGSGSTGNGCDPFSGGESGDSGGGQEDVGGDGFMLWIGNLRSLNVGPGGMRIKWPDAFPGTFSMWQDDDWKRRLEFVGTDLYSIRVAQGTPMLQITDLKARPHAKVTFFASTDDCKGTTLEGAIEHKSWRSQYHVWIELANNAPWNELGCPDDRESADLDADNGKPSWTFTQYHVRVAMFSVLHDDGY